MHAKGYIVEQISSTKSLRQNKLKKVFLSHYSTLSDAEACGSNGLCLTQPPYRAFKGLTLGETAGTVEKHPATGELIHQKVAGTSWPRRLNKKRLKWVRKPLVGRCAGLH